MKKLHILILLFLGMLVISGLLFPHAAQKAKTLVSSTIPTIAPPSDPLSIQTMRRQSYPGSNLAIEQTLTDGNNYHQYIASYTSDGLKIYGLLAVPIGEAPKGGWPAIIFNHGYIPPETYQTNPSVGQYATYLPVFARNGYVVFKPDYRGNGNSEGSPVGAYYDPGYTVDDLNAIASVKKLSYVNANKIGLWGHSMGGNITMRVLVTEPGIAKAAVIWGGVVGSYEDLINWHDPKYHPPAGQVALRNKHRAELIAKYGSPSQNSAFWRSIDPTDFVGDVTTPVQLHAGDADEEVPPAFSESFYNKLKQAGKKTTEFYTYPGADHNISQGFDLAMQRSLAFFDKYVKAE